METVRAAVRMLVTIMIGTIRAMRPGGVRALVAENIALRQQLLVLKRGRKRAPDLRAADRLILALSSLLIRASRFRGSPSPYGRRHCCSSIVHSCAASTAGCSHRSLGQSRDRRGRPLSFERLSCL